MYHKQKHSKCDILILSLYLNFLKIYVKPLLIAPRTTNQNYIFSIPFRPVEILLTKLMVQLRLFF